MDYLALGLVILVAGIHFLFGWKEYSGRNKPEFYEKFNIRLAENQR